MLSDLFRLSKLPPEHQGAFNRVIRRDQLLNSRLYTAVLLLISLTFLFSDYQFLPQDFESVAAIRVSVVVVCMIGLWFAGFVSPNVAFLMVASGLVLYNAAIVYIGVLAASHGLDTYQQGTVLIIIYCCTLFQAPLLHTAVITILCCLTYVVGIVLFSATDLFVILNNVLVFVTATVLGLLAVTQREGYLVQHFLHTQGLKNLNKEVNKQALTDPLTQLPNRFSIMNRLESYQGNVPSGLLIMMIDVDDFKKVSDGHGHAVGDRALKAVADVLKQRVDSEQGYIARYGGEEFLILLENVSRTSAEKMASNLIEVVSDINTFDLPKLTVSIGAYVTTGFEQSISVCIEVADQELLGAKNNGKNQARFAGFHAG